MKGFIKFLVVMFAFVAFSFMVGCAKAPGKSGDKNVGTTPTGNKGITVNKINYEEVKDEGIPSGLRNKIDKLKEQKGFLYEEKDGYYYIAILAGMKPTGGHSIKVTSVEDNEGKTNIVVEEKSPKPGDIVTQAITYPYTVVRVKGVTNNFVIKNTKGESFAQLK